VKIKRWDVYAPQRVNVFENG